MNLLIITIVVASALILSFISKLINKLRQSNKTADTLDAKIVSRKKATDKDGFTKYYATFEFINSDTLELEVPLLIYELAKNKITGELTYTSMKFIKFIKSSGSRINNQFKKSY